MNLRRESHTRLLLLQASLQIRLLRELDARRGPAQDASAAAAVLTREDEDMQVSEDGSGGPCGNPTQSAVMLAMGGAGSRVNLHECVRDAVALVCS